MTARERGWLLPPAAVCLTLGVLLGRASASMLWSLAALGLCFAAACLLRNRGRWIACLAFALAVGTFAGFLAFHPSLPAEGEYAVQGILTEEIRDGNFNQHTTRLSHVTLDGKPFSGSLYWTFYSDEDIPGLLPGCYVTFRASLYHPSGECNPDAYNMREALLQRGMTAAVYGMEDLRAEEAPWFSLPGFAARCRHMLSLSLLQALGEETGAYAVTMLLGSHSLIPSEDRAAFSRLGITHLLSVSGFHVGILCALLLLLLRLFPIGQKGTFVLTAAVLLFYCLLCGMSQPVLRASVLVLLGMLGRILRRPRSPLHLLSAAYILLVLLSPVQITGISFRLTFGAMLGIVWIGPTLMKRLAVRNRLLRKVLQAFAMTVAVQLGILIPQLDAYQQFPLLTFLINIPAMFLGSLMIGLYWVALFLIPIPGLSALIAPAASFLTSGLTEGIRRLSALPGICLWTPAPSWLTVLGVAAVFAALCPFARFPVRFRLPAFLLGLTLTVGSLIPGYHTTTEYIQFSAGNADAAVLWDQDRVYVYDTGEDDGIVSGYLRRRRLSPTAVILTHLHADHAGGLRSLTDDGIPIPVIYLPAGAEDQRIHEDIRQLLAELKAAGTEFRSLSRGDEISLPSGSVQVLWPEETAVRPRQDANDYSLVSLLTLNGNTLLQCGDLSGVYEPYVTVPARILKVSHHGSSSSTTPSFLSGVAPRALILTCSREKRIQDFAERTAVTAPLYATPQTGAITVRFLPDGFRIIPYLPGS